MLGARKLTTREEKGIAYISIAGIQFCMSSVEPSWDFYRTFLSVVREGSFSAASRQLGLTQPTVGRQIETLEAQLGTNLFIRSPRGLIPTPAGRELVPQAEAMAFAAAALRRVSSGSVKGETGTVRVTVSEFMGTEILPPMLAKFCGQYPAIELELTLSNRNEDLLRRDADIAVRMARPIQKALIARRIGEMKMGLFAHRKYIEAFGVPRSFDEVSNHRAIGFDRDMHVMQTAGRSTAHLWPKRFNFRCDNVAAQMAAMRAGVGIAVCEPQIAARDRNLVRVLPDSFSIRREMWLAMHKDAKSTRRVRLLFDHLAQELGDYIGRG